MPELPGALGLIFEPEVQTCLWRLLGVVGAAEWRVGAEHYAVEAKYVDGLPEHVVAERRRRL
ncbi:hypothetical protein FDA94_29430 [Herbidospora galbida]|uniref:Uncharacterized protein n=1 Tax=Herbidospora galbida TaxID=2575442 RepID=A0A4U3M8X0_9ACTN|nr:hypothetical protein [Herbidospora galbida]TKK84464.1 hypothetical protein FDA94_29430 [Herbidospora galbida]